MRLKMSRWQREHAESERLDAAQDRYERFVAAFGPATELSDQQLAALVAFCSDLTDVWAPTIAAELLRGRPWEFTDDVDALDEDDPRVRRVVALAESSSRDRREGPAQQDPKSEATTAEWPPCPDVTVDMVVFAGDDDPHLLLIKRGDAPYRGCYALPGGYTVAGERLVGAVRREVVEETGLEVGALERVGVYDDPGRDPRGHVLSVAYGTRLSATQDVRAGDDAAAAEWIPLGTVLRGEIHLAFDHGHIITDAAETLGVAVR